MKKSIAFLILFTASTTWAGPMDKKYADQQECMAAIGDFKTCHCAASNDTTPRCCKGLETCNKMVEKGMSDPDVQEAYEKCLKKLKKKGCQVE
jgi:hypothetical protein